MASRRQFYGQSLRRPMMGPTAVTGRRLWAIMPPPMAVAVDWAEVKKDIVAVIADPSGTKAKGSNGIGEKGPTLVRLAWHSSGTYDKMSQTGGSGGGTIRFKEELAHGGNAGLENAVAWLESVYAKHPGISYADLYTYAGEARTERRMLAYYVLNLADKGKLAQVTRLIPLRMTCLRCP